MNKYLSISMITKEALRVFKNNLSFANAINRQYDDKFAVAGAKIGDTLNVRKPYRPTVTKGRVLTVQDYKEESTPLVLDTQAHVGLQFTSKDRLLNLDDFSKRVIEPAAVQLANQIDFDCLGMAKKIYNAVGTPGTTPSTLAVALSAGVKLDNNAAPMDGNRHIILNPAAQASFVDGLKLLFQSSEQIKKQYEKGVMGLAAGFKWHMDQNVNVHTTGPQGGTTIEVDGTASDIAAGELETKGWTAAAALRLRVGDVFSVEGVYAVNPVNRQNTGQLAQFVVTQNFSSESDGTGTIHFEPPMIVSGQQQNVTAAPAGDADVYVLDKTPNPGDVATPMNLAFHKDAFTLAMADLPLPEGTDKASRASDPDAGLSIRIVSDYDIVNDMFICRMDSLYGYAALRPEWACRIQG